MGIISGFSLDRNGDGYISQKEFEKAKKLGLDVSYMDKDGDGKVDSGVKAKKNSIFVGNEQRTYHQANAGDNKRAIFTLSSLVDELTGEQSEKKLERINVDEEQFKAFCKDDE